MVKKTTDGEEKRGICADGEEEIDQDVLIIMDDWNAKLKKNVKTVIVSKYNLTVI